MQIANCNSKFKIAAGLKELFPDQKIIFGPYSSGILGALANGIDIGLFLEESKE